MSVIFEEEFLAERQIISYLETLKIIQQQGQAASTLLKTEWLTLESALDRVTAEDIKSPELLPTFANSAMDGFAVRAEETVTASETQPLLIPILGNLAAGDNIPISPNDFGAWEIMTGAPFPKSFDACIRIEDIETIKDVDGHATHIKITHPAEKFQNRREVGEDFQEGMTLVKAGHRLRAEDILCLTSLGILKVPVLSLPRIGVISTGKELVAPTEKPEPGKIRNSSGPFLLAALQSRHCEVTHLGTIPDDASAFKDLINSIDSKKFDLILTTGAISMGKYDFVAGALQELGTEFYFRKVAMRPGKPVLFGRLKNGSFIIGLPGNPISGAVGLRFFVDPFLAALQKQAPEQPLRLPLAKSICKAADATSFFKGHIENINSESRVVLHDQQRPSYMHPLLTSTLWVSLAETEENIPAETMVDVYPFLRRD